LLDEGDGLVGKSVGEVLAVGAVRERGALVRAEVALRVPPLASGDVDLEAVLVGPGAPRTQVPLADVPGAVSAGAQRAGDRVLVGRQIPAIRHIVERTDAVAAD